MVTIAPAVLFGLFTWVIARERGIPGVAGLVVFFFGFFMAGTGLGHALAGAMSHWLSGGGGGHPGPIPGPGSGSGLGGPGVGVQQA